MKVALTGATGFIGSHVQRLYKHGHSDGPVRNDDQADVVASAATPSVVDLYDHRPSGGSSVSGRGHPQPVPVTPAAPT
jgi:uncharacterized protein YbjT (DUF2867 family)